MKVPQIVDKTGVSADYWNEYFAKTIYLEFGKPSDIAKSFRKYPVKKYERRFSPKKYEDVITTQNKYRVKRLNELSNIVNSTFIDISMFTQIDFKRVINEIHNLIYGMGEDYFYSKY